MTKMTEGLKRMTSFNENLFGGGYWKLCAHKRRYEIFKMIERG